MEDKPGIDGKTFFITLGNPGIELIIGEDIDFLSDPEQQPDGSWAYSFQDISGRLTKYLKDGHIPGL